MVCLTSTKLNRVLHLMGSYPRTQADPHSTVCNILTMYQHLRLCCRYVILPKDFEKGYKANVKKSDADFDFYR